MLEGYKTKYIISGSRAYIRDANYSCHNDNGEPALIWLSGPAIGSKFWYWHGKEHRVGGPAIECDDGRKSWYKMGMRHRLNAPAIVNPILSYNQYWEFNFIVIK